MMPTRAMVLAAGLGTRMRPYNGHIPKPLVEIGGKSLIDYSLDRLADAGVSAPWSTCITSLTSWNAISPRVSARRSCSPMSAPSCSAPAAVSSRPCRSWATRRSFWSIPTRSGSTGSNQTSSGSPKPSIREAMDALLLLAPTAGSVGYAGRGDFAMLPDGRLRRRAEREMAPFVYAGAALLAPALFAEAPAGAFSLTLLFDRAAGKGRLFGLRLEGVWMHVGTPEAVAAAEAALAATA